MLFFAVIAVATLSASPLVIGTSQQGSPQGADVSVQVTVAPRQYVVVAFPAGANVSVLPVTGGAYSITQADANSSDTIRFEPLNQTTYEVALVSAVDGANFASVSVQGTPVSNFSAYGQITLHMTVHATNSGAPGAVSNPTTGAGVLSGFTQVDFEVMGALSAAAGVYFIVLAFRYRPKLSLVGLALLVVGGASILGALPALMVLGAYIAGFAALNVGWKIHLRRKR